MWSLFSLTVTTERYEFIEIPIYINHECKKKTIIRRQLYFNFKLNILLNKEQYKSSKVEEQPPYRGRK